MVHLRSLLRSPRARVWAVLLLLLTAAVAFLVWAVVRQQHGGEDDAPGAIRLQVIDGSGRPVGDAEIYVRQPAGAPPESSGSWSAETATLTLPAGREGRSVLVEARGFRSTRLDDLLEDRTLILRRGLLVRLAVVADPRPSLGDLELVLRLRPAPPSAADLSDEERERVVQLMDAATPLREGEHELPRGAFGYAVGETVAARGLLLPRPGRYAVRWGLLEPTAGVWFSLEDATPVVFSVADDARPQTFEVPVSAEEVERTKTGLAERIRRQRER